MRNINTETETHHVKSHLRLTFST